MNEQFKKVRKLLKKSQTDLAKDLEVDQSLISKIESGASMPTVEMLLKIRDLYGVKASLFFGEDAENDSQQSVSNIDYKAKCLELEKENYALLKEKDELNKKLTSKLENEITTLKRGAKSEEKVIRKPVHSVP